jgi:hypothetical protein
MKHCFVAESEWSDSELEEEMDMCGNGDTDDSVNNNETDEWNDLRCSVWKCIV